MGNMGKDKKILLYRIDEQAKSVIFVVTEDNEKVWGNISEDTYTVISFDDVFRDITEFRSNFLDYEQLTDELIGAINGRGAVFREILERFDDNRLNNFNFFTRYYSDTLRDVFTEARADIDKAGAFFNTRALKKSTEYVNDVFNHIREVMRDDWNFDFNSESDMKAFRLSFDKIIIRGNDRNEALRKNLCKFKNCDKSDILERLKNNRSNFFTVYNGYCNLSRFFGYQPAGMERSGMESG